MGAAMITKMKDDVVELEVSQGINIKVRKIQSLQFYLKAQYKFKK